MGLNRGLDRAYLGARKRLVVGLRPRLLGLRLAVRLEVRGVVLHGPVAAHELTAGGWGVMESGVSGEIGLGYRLHERAWIEA